MTTSSPNDIATEYSALPEKDGDIDWNAIACEYHQHILSPFAPEMVVVGEGGVRRNILLDELLSLPAAQLAAGDIADFGCGPGNLIPYLRGRLSRLTGVDMSSASLAVAGSAASACQIDFDGVLGDLRDLDLSPQMFDVLVAINSVLPQSRTDVARILATVRRHLKPFGRLLAILPSYDTTLYLASLWFEKLRAETGEREAQMAVDKFRKEKKADDVQLSYAEDGQVSQCLHTPESIEKEFAVAGLELVAAPRKVYYPWALTRRFDYGDFPEAPEEIWDWYVVATRTT